MLRPALPANRNLDGDGLPFLSGLTVLSTIHCSAGFTLNTSEVYLSYINQTLRDTRHVPSGGGGGGGRLRRREELQDEGRCRGGWVGEAGAQRTLPFQLLHGDGAERCTKVHYCIPPFSAIRVRRVLRQRRRDRFTGESSAAQLLSPVFLHPGNSPSVGRNCRAQDLDSQTQLGRDILMVPVWAEQMLSVNGRSSE